MSFQNKDVLKYFLFAIFALLMPAANFMIGNVGSVCLENGPCLIPVGFGMMAPSGVLLVGFALVLRDWLQELTSWKWSAVAVLTGGFLSFITADPYIAIASALAFVTAEMFDLAVYTPLRKSGRHLAVLFSGIVGAFVDSALFVYVAFGSFDMSMGTTVGKLYATVLVSMFLWFRFKRNNKNES